MKDKDFEHILYSENRDLCTFPKGYRFEHIRLLEDEEGSNWIHGVGFLGCHTWVKLSPLQRNHFWKLIAQQDSLV